MKLHHFKPKKQKRGLLYQVFFVVAIIQVGLLVAFSTYVVSRSFISEQIVEAPPQTEKVEPVQQERKVRVERQQKKSQKPSRRISIANPNNINAPDVQVNVPLTGMVGGALSPISDKEMTTNMTVHVTTVDIGGIKSKTEKVLICVDVGKRLMSDKLGGLDTYRVIREDIKKLVKALPPTVLFNLMVYDTAGWAAANYFQPTLVAATKSNKEEACNWIEPFNSSLTKTGVGRNNYQLKYPFLPQAPNSPTYHNGVSHVYRIYQSALEQGADTIYFLTTSWTSPGALKMDMTDTEFARYRTALERFADAKSREMRKLGWSAEKLREYNNAYELAEQAGLARGREWVVRENNSRKAKGVSLYVGGAGAAARSKGFIKYPANVPPKPKLKAPDPNYKAYSMRSVFDHYKPLFKEVYLDKKMQLPKVNMILFIGKDEEMDPSKNKTIRSFTTANRGGRSRVLRGLSAVE